ncbi:tetraspanin-10-like [Gadus chalcogrammus]|uniref:tetraspanin-10-like n=1 Tax=Gadus chalcogrammus TaxID=1042646 RepID=UPI0024C3DA74|nr:tetraspanin-10-like [Gadus chalcogrammus]
MSGFWASRRPFWPWSRGDATQNESSPLIPKEGQAAVGEPPYGPVGDAEPRYDGSGENQGSSQSDPKTFTPRRRRHRHQRTTGYSFGDHCLKLLVFSSNLLFSVLGMAVLCLGLWGLITKESFAQERIGSIGTDPMLAFVALGSLLGALCLSGCVGALRENGCLLRCFSAAVLALIAAQVLAAIAAFSLQGEVEGYLRSGLLVAMARYQDDLDLRFIVDEIQTGLECCGADDYRDWEVNIYYNCSAPGVLACGVPATCCVAPLENGTVWNSQCGVGAQALDLFSAQSVVFLGGCLGGTARWVERHSAAIGVAGVVVLGVQILTLSAAARLLDTIQWHKAYSRGLPR